MLIQGKITHQLPVDSPSNLAAPTFCLNHCIWSSRRSNRTGCAWVPMCFSIQKSIRSYGKISGLWHYLQNKSKTCHSQTIALYTCLFMQLSNQPVMWQQHNACNHANTVQLLQLTFTSNDRMEKKWLWPWHYCCFPTSWFEYLWNYLSPGIFPTQ